MNKKNKTRDVAAIVFALIVPSLITLVYFQWLQGSQSAAQQIAYAVGKAIQFGFPAVFVWFCYREKFFNTSPTPERVNPAPAPTHRSRLGIGIVFGCLVAISMFTIFFVWLPSEVIERLKTMASEKVTSFGFDSPLKYLALAAFYTLVHSFLEEYYWRWFVFDVSRKHLPTWLSNLISSLGFMAHHVIVLGFFFGWQSPLTYLFSIGIAVGGSVWAMLFASENRLRSCWISHAIVDAAIFALGYWMIFG